MQGSVNSGLYANSKTTLKDWAVEGGYMLVPVTLELVGGYQSQDADGYSTKWTRQSVGANYFIAKQDIKIQLTYERNKDKDGIAGKDEDIVYLQSQYVF